ncbi:hypothetical protein D3C86_1865080 [compost metagenome]
MVREAKQISRGRMKSSASRLICGTALPGVMRVNQVTHKSAVGFFNPRSAGKGRAIPIGVPWCRCRFKACKRVSTALVTNSG